MQLEFWSKTRAQEFAPRQQLGYTRLRAEAKLLVSLSSKASHVHQEHNHSRKAIKRFVQANAVPQNRQAFSICKDVHDQGLARC
ncbi:hypothetical protein WJX77_010692 [Trebouxia sp. C0004]